MMKRILLPLMMFGTVMTHSPATARDWGQVSGWYVSSAGETCGMFAQQKDAGASEIVILKRLDGVLFVQVRNPQWITDAASAAALKYSVDGQDYSALSDIKAIENGYIANFGEGFENELRAGATLTMRRDSVDLAQFSLSGTLAAFDKVKSCLADLRTSPGTTLMAIAVKSPRPISPERWISNSDYPSSALREKREGSAGFQVKVAKDGSVKDCQIIESSGYADLDEATCRTITKKARFKPAEDAGGNKVEAIYASKVSWISP